MSVKSCILWSRKKTSSFYQQVKVSYIWTGGHFQFFNEWVVWEVEPLHLSRTWRGAEAHSFWFGPGLTLTVIEIVSNTFYIQLNASADNSTGGVHRFWNIFFLLISIMKAWKRENDILCAIFCTLACIYLFILK